MPSSEQSAYKSWKLEHFSTVFSLIWQATHQVEEEKYFFFFFFPPLLKENPHPWLAGLLRPWLCSPLHLQTLKVKSSRFSRLVQYRFIHVESVQYDWQAFLSCVHHAPRENFRPKPVYSRDKKSSGAPVIRNWLLFLSLSLSLSVGSMRKRGMFLSHYSNSVNKRMKEKSKLASSFFYLTSYFRRNKMPRRY